MREAAPTAGRRAPRPAAAERDARNGERGQRYGARVGARRGGRGAGARGLRRKRRRARAASQRLPRRTHVGARAGPTPTRGTDAAGAAAEEAARPFAAPALYAPGHVGAVESGAGGREARLNRRAPRRHADGGHGGPRHADHVALSAALWHWRRRPERAHVHESRPVRAAQPALVGHSAVRALRTAAPRRQADVRRNARSREQLRNPERPARVRREGSRRTARAGAGGRQRRPCCCRTSR